MSLIADVSFWPTQIGGWVALITAILAVIGTAIGFIYRTGRIQQKFEDTITAIRRDGEERFTSQGKRLGLLEQTCTKNNTSIEDLRRTDQAHTFQIDTNSRELGRLSGEIKEIGTLLHSSVEHRRRMESQFRERMARIEERLKLSRLED